MINENIELLEVIRTDKANDKVKCKCKLCGNEFIMWRSHYYRGSTVCHCDSRVNNHRIHSIFTNMKTRCYNNNSPNYKDYGGRGITICDEWLNNYHAFEEWALSNGYSDDLTIERIDVDGNYSPENCKWATQLEQAQNKRATIKIEGKSLRRWCIEHGLNYKTIHSYMTRHPRASIEEALEKYLK